MIAQTKAKMSFKDSGGGGGRLLQKRKAHSSQVSSSSTSSNDVRTPRKSDLFSGYGSSDQSDHSGQDDDEESPDCTPNGKDNGSDDDGSDDDGLADNGDWKSKLEIIHRVPHRNEVELMLGLLDSRHAKSQSVLYQNFFSLFAFLAMDSIQYTESVVGYLTLQGDSYTIRYNPIPNVT